MEFYTLLGGFIFLCSGCLLLLNCAFPKKRRQVTEIIFLHLHEIVEGLYFHSSLSVCLCVCLSVCVSEFLVNKIPAERMHRFGRSFR